MCPEDDSNYEPESIDGCSIDTVCSNSVCVPIDKDECSECNPDYKNYKDYSSFCYWNKELG